MSMASPNDILGASGMRSAGTPNGCCVLILIVALAGAASALLF